MMKYDIVPTTRFKKDLKLAKKRGLKLDLLTKVIKKLSSGEPLPKKNKDHDLSGNYNGFRECHIQPDWLLIYTIDDRLLILTLVRTGSHGDLF